MEEQMKTEKIELFIAPEDKELILQGAKKAGMTVSAFLRYAALMDMALDGNAKAWKRLAAPAKAMLLKKVRKLFGQEKSPA